MKDETVHVVINVRNIVYFLYTYKIVNPNQFESRRFVIN